MFKPVPSALKRLFFSFFVFGIFQSLAQRPPFQVPAGYFLFPIRPGEVNYLSGSFAELRPDHFHAGIDIKTQQREGLEVLAAAEGYVSRIRVMRSGYGNVVYLTHPSGHVTVYGHLLNFGPRLGPVVRQRQYQQETFELDLPFKPGEVSVRRGEVIGLSGNTGSSAGPHLHFEIRDDRGNVLDPQRFNFSEVQDDVPPVIQAIALRPLSSSGRVEGRFERKTFAPKRIGATSDYLLTDTIRATGPLGLELLAHDRANGTSNQNGLNCVEVRVDDVEVYGHAMEALPNAFSQDLNVHIDYATDQRTGQRFQRLYRADGNTRLPIYRNLPTRGWLIPQPGRTHRVTVRVWDSFQNKAELSFVVRGELAPTFQVPTDSVLDSAPVPRQPVLLNQRIDENTLVLTAQNVPPGEATATLLRGGKPRTLTPAYATETETVFLYDLRRGLPDSVRVAGVTQPTYLLQTYYPGQAARLVAGATVLELGEQTLYDTLYLTGRQRGDILELGSPLIPLKSAVQVDIQPNAPVPLPEKSSVYRVDRGRPRFLGGIWQPDGCIRFITRNWGQFMILADTIPPRIRLLRKSPEGFAFSIADERSGIHSFRAEVDSQWVLTNYDFKRNLIWSEKLDPTVPFSGELTLEVVDNSGNRATFRADFSTPVPASKSPATRRKRR
jgi:hypothetical protein